MLTRTEFGFIESWSVTSNFVDFYDKEGLFLFCLDVTKREIQKNIYGASLSRDEMRDAR